MNMINVRFRFLRTEGIFHFSGTWYTMALRGGIIKIRKE